jgi:glycosyltransferase involved in cell wall biosynthesis
MIDSIEISIVSPVFNGRDTVSKFVHQTRQELIKFSVNFEIILVDDGCQRGSWQIIEEECLKDSRIKGVRLSRNFGQQIAVSAGLFFARGSKVIVLDSDLQNPISAIPQILEKLESGNDIVYTVSKVRNNLIDECTSGLFWFVVNGLLGANMIPNQLSMKGFSRRFLSVYNEYHERVRVVAGITADIGMQSAVLEVKNDRRKSGYGNYTFFKRFNLMVDILLAITSRPLNVLINISLIALIASLGLGIYTIINYIRYPDITPGYATIITLMIFFGSMTLLVLGIIGRYLSNIYIEVRQRPLFILQEKINF